jgi:hypothetical protein
MKILTFLSFGLIFTMGEAIAATTTIDTFASLRFYADAGNFLANIGEKHSNKSKYSTNLLKIACISDCKSATYYEEKIDDYPIGLFRASDDDDLLISTWASGSAYVIRVYKIQAGLITKVLDQHSLGVPEVTGSEKFDLTIVTTAKSGRGDLDAPINAKWRWDGNKFSRLK